MSGNKAWNALIRTHHITSRKKVAELKQVASHENVFALLRSGSSPGIMYVEGEETGVKNWVAAVQKLRYKDFQLVARPGECQAGDGTREGHLGLFETESVKDFAAQMEQRRVLGWWRKAMGYTSDYGRL